MQIDLELKIKDIDNDFYKCLARLKNIKIILDNISIEKMEKFQQEEILVDLGRVGELAFKYLLKLKQLEIYPNQPYEQFARTQPIFKMSTLKDLKNKNIITEKDLEELTNFTDETAQPFHNYSYLSLILEKTIPEVYLNFKKYIEYKEQSQEIKKILNLNDEFDQVFVTHIIFPELLWIGNIEIPEEKIKKIMKIMTDVEKNTGDIFTRLRYFYNNQTSKEFNIEDIYKYIESLVEFISGIHDNYNILTTNPAMILGKKETLKYINILNKSKEEIELIFKDNINNDIIDIVNVLSAKTYSYKEIKEIKEYCKDKNLDYYMILEFNLSLKEVKFFVDKDIYDYIIMSRILHLETGGKRSLNEVEELLKEVKNDKFDNTCLIGIFTIEEIKELNKHEKLCEFIIEHYYDVFNDMLYANEFPHDLRKLLNIKVLQENPELLYSLDYSQISTHNQFIKYLKKFEKYHYLCNETCSNIYENIKKNANTYKDCPELLYSIPLMLDPEEIESILILLINEGLDITNLENFNSTILCMPSNFVYATYEILKKDNLPIIKDNNISKEFLECTNGLLKTIKNKISPIWNYYEPFRERKNDNQNLIKQRFEAYHNSLQQKK